VVKTPSDEALEFAMISAETEPAQRVEPGASSRTDRVLPLLALAVLSAAAIWFWAGNGVEVFAGIISSGLALCF
jgi:hypothetical protein